MELDNLLKEHNKWLRAFGQDGKLLHLEDTTIKNTKIEIEDFFPRKVLYERLCAIHFDFQNTA